MTERDRADKAVRRGLEQMLMNDLVEMLIDPETQRTLDSLTPEELEILLAMIESEVMCRRPVRAEEKEQI